MERYCWMNDGMEEYENGNYVEYDEAISIINALKSQWQPIESAPKDGSTIIGYWDGDICMICWGSGWSKGVVTLRKEPCWGISDGSGVILDEGWDDGTGAYLIKDGSPTHWRPLPAPPNTNHTD